MASHLQSILRQWYAQRDQHCWVLATVIKIEGSNYRKAGAMMLINDLGQYYGLLSGGCLEKSLLIDVKKVLAYGRPQCVCYDSSSDSESPWAMALGCGGKVTILLQPINVANGYHQLDSLYDALQERKRVSYVIGLSCDEDIEYPVNHVVSLCDLSSLGLPLRQNGLRHEDSDGLDWLVVSARPQPHLMVFGGGSDAVPLVQMATILGWRVTLVDSRVGYAQAVSFPGADVIIRTDTYAEVVKVLLSTIDAAVVMTHNIEMDAIAVRALQYSSASYLGLLGPVHRKQQVLDRAGVDVSAITVHGPMGIDIGGDLPESIALATLAQCHQVLEARALVSTSLRDVT